MGNYDPKMAFLLSEIKSTYDDSCVINRKSLHKFGRHDDLDTADLEAEINYLGIDPVLSETNSITHFSSSDASDTQVIRVEGCTISSGVLTFTTQDITLAGQTKTALTTPLGRVTRIANIASTVETNGDVYVYEDGTVSGGGGIPTDLTTVGNVMSAADQSTLFAGTSIASTNYFLCNGFYAYLGRRTSGFADIRFKIEQMAQYSKQI